MTNRSLDGLLAAFSSRLHAFSVCAIQDGWRLAFPPFEAVTIHFVLQGSGWVRLGENGAWHPFSPRSVIVVGSHMSHAMGDPARNGPEVQGADQCTPFGDGLVAFKAGDGRPDILMACGCVPRQEGHALGLADLLGGHPVEELGGVEAHRHVFDLMLAEVERPTLGLQAMMEALMQQCLVLLVRRRLRDDRAVPIAALSHPRLVHAVLAVLQDPAGPHSLESLAALAGMGRTTFAEGFSRTFGQPPMEFVQRMRLRVAARLLKTTDLPVKVVAASAGYASRSHFSRSFVAAYGLDPSRFRARASSGWDGAESSEGRAASSGTAPAPQP